MGEAETTERRIFKPLAGANTYVAARSADERVERRILTTSTRFLQKRAVVFRRKAAREKCKQREQSLTFY